VRDPSDPAGQRSTETLQVGRSRPLFRRVPTRGQQPAVVLLALLLGVAIGGGAALWQQGRPSPRPAFSVRVDEHAVELILLGAVGPRTHRSGPGSEINSLQVESAVLLSGLVTSTVLKIDSAGPALDVRAPALPVTVRPTARFWLLDLQVIVRDCKAATRWTPEDRPFTIAWRDEHGRKHLDRAGDFDRAMATALIRYINAVCNTPRDK
jgi:hypothetical protein